MKLLKFIALLLILTLFNSNAFAAKNCDEIKGNIVGKLFCKATDGKSLNTGTSSVKKDKDASGWSFWKKPEWMKKKN